MLQSVGPVFKSVFVFRSVSVRVTGYVSGRVQAGFGWAELVSFSSCGSGFVSFSARVDWPD